MIIREFGLLESWREWFLFLTDPKADVFDTLRGRPLYDFVVCLLSFISILVYMIKFPPHLCIFYRVLNMHFSMHDLNCLSFKYEHYALSQSIEFLEQEPYLRLFQVVL